MTSPEQPDLQKALIVKEPWITAILDGTKTWELRGVRTAHRGRIGLISSGTGLVVGEAEIVGARGPLELDELENTFEFHRVPAARFLGRLPYRATYAWQLANARRFEAPMPYLHPKGAVIWVDLLKARR